jgi:hypothetical protein
MRSKVELQGIIEVDLVAETCESLAGCTCALCKVYESAVHSCRTQCFLAQLEIGEKGRGKMRRADDECGKAFRLTCLV